MKRGTASTRRPRWTMALAVAATVAPLTGCGGGAPPAVEVAPRPQPSPRRDNRSAPPRDELEVSGLIGTISPAEVQRTLDRALGRFQRCFFEGTKEVPFLSGRVEFDFRIGADGEVTSVSLRDSTVGHVGTEACLLKRAADADFPAPRGGDSAEFRWGFALDDTGGVRPPAPWAAAALIEQRPDLGALLSTCGVTSATLTLYVNPGGQVLAGGVASSTDRSRAALECVVDGATHMAMADPGSYTAKVTLELP